MRQAACSSSALDALQFLQKSTKGNKRIRPNTLLNGLMQKCRCDHVAAKTIVRELHVNGLLTYTADSDGLPVSDVAVSQPQVELSPAQVNWASAVACSGFDDRVRELLLNSDLKVDDFDASDMQVFLSCLGELRSTGQDAFCDGGFNVSARFIMGGSKVLSKINGSVLEAMGIPLGLRKYGTPRYFICAGPSNPEATLLIENPRAFENAVNSGLSRYVALICTDGFALAYLGESWHAGENNNNLLQVVRSGNPPPLEKLLSANRIFLWADLDLAALDIFTKLRFALPRLEFSKIYEPMISMAGDERKSHPYKKLFEKEGQPKHSFLGTTHQNPALCRILEACRVRAVDQEAVLESDILKLGHLPLTT